MPRILVLLLFLASCQSQAIDVSVRRLWTDHHRLILGLSWCALASMVDASEISNSTSSPSILTTPQFAYYSIWIGNVCALFDVLGWTADWIANGWVYMKGDIEEVVLKKKRIREIHEEYKAEREENIKLAIELCATIRRHYESGDTQSTIATETLLRAIDKVKEAIDDGDDKSEPHGEVHVYRDRGADDNLAGRGD